MVNAISFNSPNLRSPETSEGVDGEAWERIKLGMAISDDGKKKTYNGCEE